jgi:hypothetical protein
MWRVLEFLSAWLRKYESVAIWLEGIALVAILLLDWRERIDQRKERQEQHREAASQMDISRRQVDAATEAALASKKSTEILAGLHRPFMGLLLVRLDAGGPGHDDWVITFVQKNFGTLPALEVGTDIEFFAGETSFAKISEPAAIQFFPSFETRITTRQTILKRIEIQNGAEKLLITVHIPYRSEDGRSFEYISQVSFDREQNAFNIDRSDTRLRFYATS